MHVPSQNDRINNRKGNAENRNNGPQQKKWACSLRASNCSDSLSTGRSRKTEQQPKRKSRKWHRSESQLPRPHNCWKTNAYHYDGHRQAIEVPPPSGDDDVRAILI